MGSCGLDFKTCCCVYNILKGTLFITVFFFTPLSADYQPLGGNIMVVPVDGEHSDALNILVSDLIAQDNQGKFIISINGI